MSHACINTSLILKMAPACINTSLILQMSPACINTSLILKMFPACIDTSLILQMPHACINTSLILQMAPACMNTSLILQMPHACINTSLILQMAPACMNTSLILQIPRHQVSSCEHFWHCAGYIILTCFGQQSSDFSEKSVCPLKGCHTGWLHFSFQYYLSQWQSQKMDTVKTTTMVHISLADDCQEKLTFWRNVSFFFSFPFHKWLGHWMLLKPNTIYFCPIDFIIFFLISPHTRSLCWTKWPLRYFSGLLFIFLFNLNCLVSTLWDEYLLHLMKKTW